MSKKIKKEQKRLEKKLESLEQEVKELTGVVIMLLSEKNKKAKEDEDTYKEAFEEKIVWEA